MAINPSSAAPPAGEVISASPGAWARAGAVGGERTASNPKTAAHITCRFTWPPEPGQSVILTSGRGPVKELCGFRTIEALGDRHDSWRKASSPTSDGTDLLPASPPCSSPRCGGCSPKRILRRGLPGCGGGGGGG